MNFTAMQDRLRQELSRRIRRGSLSVSLLARQTGLCQPHISNFLRGRRQLSLQAIDRILSAQRIDPVDMLRDSENQGSVRTDELENVPLVSASSAMFEPQIRPAATLALLHAPAGMLRDARVHTAQQRKKWQRYVAVRASDSDAAAMHPVLQPNATVLVDRHYTSLAEYRSKRHNLYAVRFDARLMFRYLDWRAERLVLRPNALEHPVELIELGPEESLLDVIVGRVVMIFNET